MYSWAYNIPLCPLTRTHMHRHTLTDTHTWHVFLFVFLLSGAWVLWQTLIYQLHKYSYTSQSGKLHQPPLFVQVWLHANTQTHKHTLVVHYGEAFLNNSNLAHAPVQWANTEPHSGVFHHKLMNHVKSVTSCAHTHTHTLTSSCLIRCVSLSSCDWSHLSIISWLINWRSGSTGELITSVWESLFDQRHWGDWNQDIRWNPVWAKA